jgi:aryl-alcohol dehydrogenase-like predicted oxidoreductase
MRYTSLPGTNFRPSVIGLGTGGFGSSNPTENSFRMMDEYAAAGGNLLDSAHIYAAWLPNGIGASERTVGAWVNKSGLREKMIVVTKGGHFELPTPEISRVRPECIDRDIQESLDRLQFDSIDLYFLHRDDVSIPVAELLGALQPHIRAGRLKAIGASNWTPQRLELAAQEAKARGWTGFCCSQCAWSLADTNPARQGHLGAYYVADEALAWHRKTQFPLLAWSAQARGFFSQEWRWPGQPNPTEKQKALMDDYYSCSNVERWQRARELGKKRGCSANAIALAYVTSQPFPCVALVGPNTLEQLRSSLETADLELTPDEIAGLCKAA